MTSFGGGGGKVGVLRGLHAMGGGGAMKWGVVRDL